MDFQWWVIIPNAGSKELHYLFYSQYPRGIMWNRTQQCTIHWKPIMSQLWMNHNSVTRLGNWSPNFLRFPNNHLSVTPKANVTLIPLIDEATHYSLVLIWYHFPVSITIHHNWTYMMVCQSWHDPIDAQRQRAERKWDGPTLVPW
jgi:hypothetical protein